MNENDQMHSAGSRRLVPLLLGLILLATLAAYSPALSFQFAYDDFPQIVHNHLIQSWQYAHLYPRIHVWANSSNWGNYYRPLFLFVLLLEHTVFGLNPMGWHAVSIVFHLGVTLLVFALAREFMEQQAATVCALIFALHPIHIESVVWVSGITDPILALLAIPCMIFFMRFRKQGKYFYLWLSLLFFAGALLSKETAVIIPGLLIAYELFCAPKEEWRTSTLLQKRGLPLLLFAVLGAIYIFIRHQVLGAFSKTVTPLDAATMIRSWPGMLVKYAQLLVAPCPLSLFYDVPYVTHIGSANFWRPLCLLLLILAALGWLFKRGSGATRFAMVLLVLPILPLLNVSLLPLNETVHDRYLYLPSIGLALLAGLGWQWLRAYAERARKPALQKNANILLACVGCAFWVLTSIQSMPWASNLVLYAVSVQRAPNLPVVHNNLGNELTDRGMYDNAIAQYQQALKLLPNYWFSTFNLGYVYYKKGMYNDASIMFDRALHINPQDGDTWYYAGLTQQQLGHRDEALRDLNIAVQLSPASEQYRKALAEIQHQPGQP